MKKVGIIIFALVLVSACGGSKGITTFYIHTDLPEAALSLDVSQLKAYGSIKEGEGIIEEDVVADFLDSVHVLNFKTLNPVSYHLIIKFTYVYMDGEFSVLRAEVDAQVSENEVHVWLTPEDFVEIGGGDIDEDGLSNLGEIVSGADPMLPDSDNDGVLDGEDAFPSEVLEWGDVDSDGIGDNVDDDIDGDGISNIDEMKIGTDSYLADTDGDGISDGIDNCAFVSNADQADSDANDLGDACDDDNDGDGLTDEEEAIWGTDPNLSDTDNDGLSDSMEVAYGSNPSLRDSDSDGFVDGDDSFPTDPNEWNDADNDGTGDFSDNCPDISNEDQLNFDNDQYGDVCDDDIDGNGLPYVFLSSEIGDDENLGLYSRPVRTLQRAIALAYQRGEIVIASAGNYDVSNVVFRNGVNLKGGYAHSYFYNKLTNPDDHRDYRSEDSLYRSTLYNSTSSNTLNFNNSHLDITLEGFHIINDAEVKTSTVVCLKNTNASVFLDKCTLILNSQAENSFGVNVVGGSARLNALWIEKREGNESYKSVGIRSENSFPVITNSIIKAGYARHTIGIEIFSGSPTIVNNTIDGSSLSHLSGTASGISVINSDPLIVNNIIAASSAENSDAIPLKCFGKGFIFAEFDRNILTAFKGENVPLHADCDGSVYYPDDLENGATGNISYVGTFASLFSIEYDLNNNIPVDVGLETSNIKYGFVETDFDGNERPSGGYDIGAKELEGWSFGWPW